MVAISHALSRRALVAVSRSCPFEPRASLRSRERDQGSNEVKATPMKGLLKGALAARRAMRRANAPSTLLVASMPVFEDPSEETCVNGVADRGFTGASRAR